MSTLSLSLSYAPIDLSTSSLVRYRRPIGLLGTLSWTAAATAAACMPLAVAGVSMGLSGHVRLGPVMDDPRNWVVLGGSYAAFIATIVWACRRYGWRATDYLGLIRPRGSYLEVTALWLAVQAGFAAALVYVETHQMTQSGSVDASMPGALAFLVWATLIAPITEEALFRGFLFRGFASSRLGTAGAIVATSLLWTICHCGRPWPAMLLLFCFGVILGWLRQRSGSIVATISLHSFYNTSVLLIGLVLGLS